MSTTLKFGFAVERNSLWLFMTELATKATGLFRERSMVVVALAALALSLVAACSGGDGGTSATDPAACATDNPVAESDLERLPKGLPLDEWGTVLKVQNREGYVGAEMISETIIVELYPEISRAVRAGGYETISGENEGFEAELFFQKGQNIGSFLLRKGPCEGQVTVKLIYGSTPAAKASPSMNTGGGNN